MSTLDDITKVAPAKPVIASTPAPVPSLEIKPKSMTDIYTQLTRKPDVEIDPKRERNRAIVSAIGDGLSALSNLYFTTKGAPSVEQPKLSEKNVARYNYLKDLRGKQEAAYNAGLMNAMDRDYQIGENDRKWKYQSDRDSLLDNRYKENADAERNKWNTEFEYKKGQDALAQSNFDRKLELEREQMEADEKRWRAQLAISSGKSEKIAEQKEAAANLKRIEKENRNNTIVVYDSMGKPIKVDRRFISPSMRREFLSNAIKKDLGGYKSGGWVNNSKDSSPYGRSDFNNSPTARKFATDMGKYWGGDSDDFSQYKVDDFSQYKVD